MHRVTRRLWLVAVLILVLCGCAATPRQQFTTASAAYIAAVNTAMALQDQGLLTPERQAQIAVAEQVAYTALTTWGEALQSDEPIRVYVRAFYDALEALTLKLLDEGEGDDEAVRP